MVVILHGAAGGWDELAIAVAALAVLWVAVKLAGRKPASADDDEQDDAAPTPAHPVEQEQTDPAPSSVQRSG
jgi:hypothetical protein